MGDYEGTNKEGQFNQALAIQQRLNDLFREVDIRSVYLFQFDADKQEWNYNIVLNCLTAIYSTVSETFKDEEKKDIESQRISIRDVVRSNKPTRIINKQVSCFSKTTPFTRNDYTAQDNISDNLLKLRLTIEQFMGKHGLSNPSKSDVTKSMVKL